MKSIHRSIAKNYPWKISWEGSKLGVKHISPLSKSLKNNQFFHQISIIQTHFVKKNMNSRNHIVSVKMLITRKTRTKIHLSYPRLWGRASVSETESRIFWFFLFWFLSTNTWIHRVKWPHSTTAHILKNNNKTLQLILKSGLINFLKLSLQYVFIIIHSDPVTSKQCIQLNQCIHHAAISKLLKEL